METSRHEQFNSQIELNFLKGFEYNDESYLMIKPLLQNHDINGIKNLIYGDDSGTTDNLLIYTLKNDDTSFLIAVLDKFDLWSAPYILEVFSSS